MTILKYAAATAVMVSLLFGVIASVLPLTVGAYSAPKCVFNTIVQPFNAGGTTLSWKVYNAHTITISGIGEVSEADSIVVYPSSVTDYILTATGINGSVDTCEVTAQPVSAYPHVGQTGYWYNTYQDSQKCSMNVSPDFVVPGGTAVLSWTAPGADYVEIDHGIGNLSDSGSRVVPNTGVPQTFTLKAKWGNGVERTCSAVVKPTGPIAAPTFSGGVNIPGAFVAQTPGVTLPAPTYPATYPAHFVPQVTAIYTPPTTAYVPINQVPYTGTNDTAYVLTLLAVALGAFTLLYTRREKITSVVTSLV